VKEFLVVDSAPEVVVSADRSLLIPALQTVAARLRLESILTTSEAGSGHPSSCCSAADIVATLFFAEMRFDPKNPQYDANDRFVLSKGHAAPLLYAAWAEAGFVTRKELRGLRKMDCDLEGHPTPRLAFVDVATGSLGQGICAAIGLALNARRLGSDYRTYVLVGDGESAEGSVWEAAQAGQGFKLDNLCAVTDVNALGQSRATQWGHDMEAYACRWRAFGWHAVVVDGHDHRALLDAFEEARRIKGQPTMILARTLKGKGVPLMEGKEGWHGKAIPQGDSLDQATEALKQQVVPGATTPSIPMPPVCPAVSVSERPLLPAPSYAIGEKVATREAYGSALVALGKADPRVVALDADVGNSTFSEKFERALPGRFYETYIAEQVMVGAAVGLASRGAIPFPSTFACFLTRASDFIRMAGIGGKRANVKFCGSHAGVSIGEDGPSQMALEDLSMMRSVPGCAVLYPCDGVSAERLVASAAAYDGMVYIRTSRPKTDVIYANEEQFGIGGSKVLHESVDDVATVVAAGITVFEAREAYQRLLQEDIHIRVIDAYSIQPIDTPTLVLAGLQTGLKIITVEDHYPTGGLGDAASEAVADHGITVSRLAVREVPRSGKSEELLERYGISASHIVEAVRRQMDSGQGTANSATGPRN